MSLSFFDVAGSFAKGAHEEAQRIDKDIADRIAKLSETKQSESAKTKFTAEYAKYEKDRILLEAVKSAGGAGEDLGQMLLGGYKTMDDYQAALDANDDLYHPLFEIGKEPAYTPAEYGLTNVRDDGSKITTVGRILNKFLQPEKFERTTKELAAREDKPETVTSYRRTVDEDGNWVNPTDPEDIKKNKAAVIARSDTRQLVAEHESKQDELTTIIQDPDNKLQWLELTLTKNARHDETGEEKMDLAAANARGDSGIFSGYSVSNVEKYEQAGSIPNGSEMEYIRQGVLVDIDDNVLENQTELLTTRNGESLDGKRHATQNVKVVRTGNIEDTIVMNGEIHTGWEYMHQVVVPKPDIARKAELTFLQQNKDDDGNDLLGKTKYTLTLTSDGSTGEIARTFGIRKNGDYKYKGYQVTSKDTEYKAELESTQDWIDQRFVRDGKIMTATQAGAYANSGKTEEGVQLLDVKLTAKFTGEDTDFITYFEGQTNQSKEYGYKLIGQEIIAPKDDRTESSKKLNEQAKEVMIRADLGVDYSQIIKRMGLIDENGNALPITLDIAKLLVDRRNMLKVTERGDVIDVIAAQFDVATPLYDLKPAGWSNLTPKQVEKYSLGYFGKVPETDYYKDMEDAKHYMSWINSKARTWANSYYMDEADAVSVVERLALLGVQKEPGNMDFNDLWFNQFGTVHRHPTKYIEYSLNDIFAQARAYKNLDSQRNLTWHQSLTKFFEAIKLDEAALKKLRDD